MSKIETAIIDSGNIGTDLMIKMIKWPKNVEPVAVVAIDEKSKGLAMGRECGVETTHEGFGDLQNMAIYQEIGIVFDAISTYAHKVHDAALRADVSRWSPSPQPLSVAIRFPR